MDPSFSGCPLYVGHVDHVDFTKVREADGVVVRSFLNEADGKHWAEFMVFSEAGHRAIAQGMRLSNAYKPKSFAQGGVWNGLKYDREVVRAEFEHLALVEDPRYNESVILTPEEFKAYNERKTTELKALTNAKEKPFMAGLLNFFKRSSVKEEEASPADIIVQLPKSGKTITLEALINAADGETPEEHKAPEAPATPKVEAETPKVMEAPKAAIANDMDEVDSKHGKMTVAEMKDRHDRMQDCMNAMAELMKPKAEEKKAPEAAAKEEPVKNTDEPETQPTPILAEGVTTNEIVPPATTEFEAALTGTPHMDKLKNAESEARRRAQPAAMPFAGTQLGKQRYGSN